MGKYVMNPKTSPSLVDVCEARGGVVTGTTLDLRDADHAQLLEEHYYRRTTWSPPVLVCTDHRVPVCLQKRPRGEAYNLWIVSQDGHHTKQHAPSLMTDAHKYEAEYWVRAEQKVGAVTATEVSLSTRRRTDVVGSLNGYRLGTEIQLAHLTRDAAVKRTKDAINGGLDAVIWCDDKGNRSNAQWRFRVPTVVMNERPWDVLPPPRSATVTTGVREIITQRCAPGAHLPCPERKSGYCGKRHLGHQPWLHLTVDDVAEMALTQQLVPLRYKPPGIRRDAVLLVSPESLRLYEEMTGRPAERPAFIPNAEIRMHRFTDRGANCYIHHGPDVTAAPAIAVPDISASMRRIPANTWFVLGSGETIRAETATPAQTRAWLTQQIASGHTGYTTVERVKLVLTVQERLGVPLGVAERLLLEQRTAGGPMA